MATPEDRPGDPREWRVGIAFACLTAVLWGFLAIAMKVASDAVPVLTIVWFRFAFAFVLLALFVGRRSARRLTILVRPPLLGVAAAGFLTLNYVGYLAGLAHTTPTNAQVLIQTAPMFFALAGIAFFRERLNRAQLAGLALAVVGFVLFAQDQRGAAVVAPEDLARGNLLILGAALAWAAYAVLQKLLTLRGFRPQDLNLLLYLVPAATLWPLADFDVLAGLGPGLWLLMAFLGANTLIAYGALAEAIRRIPAYQVSLIITCNPLITLVVMAVLGALEVSWAPADRVGVLGYGAALLVVGGVVQVLARARRAPAEAAE